MKKIIILTGSLIVLAVIVFIVQDTSKKPSPEEVVMCTMEALMCPDGSSVGRGAPLCAFASCPHQDSFEGVLSRDGEGLRLIMQVPPGGMGVTYVMPLRIPGAVNREELIDKKVVVMGDFMEGNTLEVKSIEALKGDLADKTKGEVSLGKTVFINGVNITLLDIVQDNRCPSDVVCIVKGSVVVKVALKSDTDVETKNINADDAPFGFDSFQISIENVVPYPSTKKSLEKTDYRVQFKVVQN